MHVYIIIMIKYHQRKTSNLFTFHKIHKLDVTICNCNIKSYSCTKYGNIQ